MKSDGEVYQDDGLKGQCFVTGSDGNGGARDKESREKIEGQRGRLERRDSRRVAELLVSA